MADAIDQLRADLAGENAEKRLRAAEALAKLGLDARPAAVELARACGNADADAEVREWAAAALEELGPPEEGDAAALAALVPSLETDVAYWAATLLGRLGNRAGGFVDPLAEAVTGHRHQHVRHRAAWALGEIATDTPAVRGALTMASRADDPRLARLAARALEALRQ